MQQTNILMDKERKQREQDERNAEIARDRAELKWTNDTELKFNASRSYADKYLKK